MLDKNGIVVRQVANKFDIINTLKMLEYSINNWKAIKKEQRQIEYNDNYCNWKINSIDTTRSVAILKTTESNILQKIKEKKIYRPEKDFKNGFTYFWQNEKFNIIYIEKNKEKKITSLSNVYDIQKKWNTVFIFESSADFIVFDTYKKDLVSKKWTIENAEKNYRLYHIEHIGGDKFSISFNYYSKEPGIQPKNQILIYSLYDDKLIQDLDKLMKE